MENIKITTVIINTLVALVVTTIIVCAISLAIAIVKNPAITTVLN